MGYKESKVVLLKYNQIQQKQLVNHKMQNEQQSKAKSPSTGLVIPFPF